jgi:hypothetical protein
MALSILDGTQTATTLSTILSSGQHITAHTVVSLGTQAITDMRSAVSGSIVSISNLPATQTIAGTVTVGNIQGYQHATAGTSGPYSADVILVGEDIESGSAGGLVVIPAAKGGGVLGGRTLQGDTPICVYGDNGSAVTISGTVTANTFALQGTAVTTSNFTSTTASTVLASFNATREVLTIFNEGAGNLHICAGATCTTIAYQVRLSAGDYYEVPNHQTTITHSAVFATAGTARVTEVS